VLLTIFFITLIKKYILFTCLKGYISHLHVTDLFGPFPLPKPPTALNKCINPKRVYLFFLILKVFAIRFSIQPKRLLSPQFLRRAKFRGDFSKTSIYTSPKSLAPTLILSTLSKTSISLSVRCSVTMAQVVVTRSIQSSLLCPSTGSVQDRVEKLKPSSFASKVLGLEEKKSYRAVHRRSRIVARGSARAEPEVVPVSPEDVPNVGPIYTMFFHFL
jgi:hypothetical protein